MRAHTIKLRKNLFGPALGILGGICSVWLVWGAWAVLRNALYPYASQTIYTKQIDDRNTIHIFTKVSGIAGVEVYCELLHDGRPVPSPTDLFLDNRPRRELQFEVITAGDSLAAVVRPSEPLKVRFLVDLKTMEANRQGYSEAFDDYLKRQPMLLERFRAATSEPGYHY